jgi:hypothetical protein
MVEKLHQLYQCQFGTLTTIHVVHLPAKSLTQGVATKVVDLQAVLAFQLLQDGINPLDAISCSLLTYQDRRFNAYGLYMSEAVLDVFL